MLFSSANLILLPHLFNLHQRSHFPIASAWMHYKLHFTPCFSVAAHCVGIGQRLIFFHFWLWVMQSKTSEWTFITDTVMWQLPGTFVFIIVLCHWSFCFFPGIWFQHFSSIFFPTHRDQSNKAIWSFSLNVIRFNAIWMVPLVQPILLQWRALKLIAHNTMGSFQSAY